MGIGSLFSPCGSWGLNSAAALSASPSCQCPKPPLSQLLFIIRMNGPLLALLSELSHYSGYFLPSGAFSSLTVLHLLPSPLLSLAFLALAVSSLLFSQLWTPPEASGPVLLTTSSLMGWSRPQFLYRTPSNTTGPSFLLLQRIYVYVRHSISLLFVSYSLLCK